jgi:hypothetical protein
MHAAGRARAIGDRGVALAAGERERERSRECIVRGELHWWVTALVRPKMGRLIRCSVGDILGCYSSIFRPHFRIWGYLQWRGDPNPILDLPLLEFSSHARPLFQLSLDTGFPCHLRLHCPSSASSLWIPRPRFLIFLVEGLPPVAAPPSRIQSRRPDAEVRRRWGCEPNASKHRPCYLLGPSTKMWAWDVVCCTQEIKNGLLGCVIVGQGRDLSFFLKPTIFLKTSLHF